MQHTLLNGESKSAFDRDGSVVAPNLLTPDQAVLLGQDARMDRSLSADRQSRADGEGGSVNLVVRNDLPKDSIYGALVRLRPLDEAMETLLGDEVYHYHHKMILNEPRVSGSWTWHQNYGYSYNNGCLFSDMGSCMLAVDHAITENGCLQVIQSSHLIGRIDHVDRGEQTGADEECVDAALRQLKLVHVNLALGSAGFFMATHCMAPTKTSVTIRVGRSSAATMQSTTPPRKNRCTRVIAHWLGGRPNASRKLPQLSSTA